MLTSVDVDAIRQATGVDIHDAKTVVREFAKAKDMDDGQYSAKVSIDQGYVPYLQETAGAIGWTPQQLIEELVNMCVGNGWIYGWVPDGGTINLSKGEAEELRSLVGGGRLTGRRVLNAIKGRMEAEKSA